MFSANTGRLAAIHPAARTIAPPTSPSRSISRVISAKNRSESVSPWTSDRASPSSPSNRPRSSITPLCANSRPRCSNGWVFSGLTAPVDAYLTWAMNVRELTSRAWRANS